jgi:hypothetical protein
LAAAILSGATFLLTVVGFRLGLLLSAIHLALAPIAVVICATAFGALAGLLHVGLSKSAARRWILLHTLGYALAGLLLVLPNVRCLAHPAPGLDGSNRSIADESASAPADAPRGLVLV